MEIWAIVVAGGSGTRFGRPKQLAELGSKRVIDWSVGALADQTGGVVVVGPPELGSEQDLGVDRVVPGGATRSESVRCGLAAMPDSATHVLIHDAARPLVPAEVVERVVAALAGGSQAVVPVVPVTDTLRSVDGLSVDRDRLVAVQTPQGFDLAMIRSAHAAGDEATDDATVAERAGTTVDHVEGSPRNLKITFPHDLVVAAGLLADAEQQPKAEPS